MKLLSGSTLALALLLAGCGEGASDNVATGNNAAPIQVIAAPSGGDWEEMVSRTPEGGVRLGNPDAPVKLVEYGSLTCPACRAFSEQGTQPLIDNYIKSGQVSWEFRHLLIHGGPDLVMARLANCQPDPAFFRTIEQLYENQATIVESLDPQEQQQLQALAPEQQLVPLARAMELDTFFARRGMPGSRFEQCLGDMNAAQQLAEQTNRAFTEEGVTGTPTFFINGEKQQAANWAELEPLLRGAIG